ncbi:MAG: hypothetical protein ACI9AU_001265 [Bacteroidia bacterium]|jgi:hypothetical protein
MGHASDKTALQNNTEVSISDKLRTKNSVLVFSTFGIHLKYN